VVILFARLIVGLEAAKNRRQRLLISLLWFMYPFASLIFFGFLSLFILLMIFNFVNGLLIKRCVVVSIFEIDRKLCTAGGRYFDKPA